MNFGKRKNDEITCASIHQIHSVSKRDVSRRNRTTKRQIKTQLQKRSQDLKNLLDHQMKDLSEHIRQSENSSNLNFHPLMNQDSLNIVAGRI